MKQCIITVLDFDKEFFPEFGIKNLSPCPMHMAGQIFHTASAKPTDLCDEAWKAICEYVSALARGASPETLTHGNSKNYPGVATCICTCNNSLRPVIFKVTIDDEACLN